MSARNRDATRITRQAYTVLAALLLADGEWVSRNEMADELFWAPVVPFAISRHIGNLERFGVDQVEQRYRAGYRLASLPADEHLDNVLAVIPEVKRSRWWSRRDIEERTA